MADPYGTDPAVAANPAAATVVSEKRINVETFEPLAPGEKRTISFSMAPSALFTSSYLFPLMHASVSIEMLLVTSSKDCVVSDLAADPGNGVIQRRTSEKWLSNQPRLCMSYNTLSSASQGELTGLARDREAEKAMLPSWVC